jgi:hypothetical protein
VIRLLRDAGMPRTFSTASVKLERLYRGMVLSAPMLAGGIALVIHSAWMARRTAS